MKRYFHIAFILVCAIATFLPLFDKRIFLRDFVNYAYGTHLFTLALVVLTGVFLTFKPKSRGLASPPPIALIIITLWAAYLLFFKLFGPQSESYYWTYLLVAFSAFGLVYSLLRLGAIGLTSLYLPMALLGVFEATVVVLQYTHVLSSNAAFFEVTGTGSNPNISAMTLCMTLPAAIEFALRVRGYSWYKKLAWVIPALIVVAILFTHCRSALLALLAVYGLYLPGLWKQRHGKGLLRGWILRALPALIVVIFVVFFVSLNRQKEASSSGRLTIWKLTGQMITEKPISGYGYGYFEKAYNLHQAEYFNSAQRSEAERMSGTYTGMAYNEYLEQTVMGGIPGGILFAAFLLSLIILGWKQLRHPGSSAAPLAGVTAFALMSLFNFTVAYPVIFLFLLFYAAGGIHLAQTSKVGLIPTLTQRKVATLTVIASTLVVLWSLPKYRAQKTLARAEQCLKRGQMVRTGNLLRKAEPAITTSEAFYNTKAQYCFATRDYRGARKALLQVLEYTSSPYPMQELAQVCAMLGDSRQAEQYLLTAAGIEPHLFRPRMQLLGLYMHSGDTLKARAVALEIVRLKPKINSPQVQAYKQQARRVLKT